MEPWIKVAELRDLKRSRRLLVQASGVGIALFIANDQVYALHDICIHKQRSLSKGTLFDGRVICPGHQWQFELETGWEDDQQQCQPSYPAKIEGDAVYVIPVARPLATASIDDSAVSAAGS